MKRIIFVLATFFIANFAYAQKVDTAYKKITNKINIKEDDVKRIISTLSADSMLGRGLYNHGAMKAADFIEREYNKIGLQHLEVAGVNGYRQGLSAVRLKSMDGTVKIGDSVVDNRNVIFVSDKSEFTWSDTTKKKPLVVNIGPKDDILSRLKILEATKEDAIVLIDASLRQFFGAYRSKFRRDRFETDTTTLSKNSYVFILSEKSTITNYNIHLKTNIEYVPLYNMIGVIPGKSKKNEYVIYSAHYDNLGVIGVNKGDSIANGADENASGVTAVLELAKYFKEKNDNERTLIFVNYGAETVSSLSSKYFAKHIDGNSVVAVVNLDAIGKESKFGPRSAFITGYDKSNLGEHFAEKANQIKFKFKADPYKDKGLFYQAANTPLGMMGVPSHTFSTIQIDIDRYFNSVRDDMNTIEVENLTEIIKAVAFVSDDLVDGKFTPSRINNYKDDPSSPKNIKRAQNSARQ